jgi:probable F420-dependent oxidoreductase
VDDSVLQVLDRSLGATTRLIFGTGILNIWKHAPAELAAWWRGQSPERQRRLLLGIGISHAPLIGEDWGKPLATTSRFIDDVVAAGMDPDRLCVAALGPKMLELAAAKTAGAHPYLITPEHTAFARKTMGPAALLAPEQGVVLETDPEKARTIARAGVASYLRLPNYVNNWRRLGYAEDEITSMSDRFIDEVVAWGDAAAIGARVKAHHDAGADHVCLQVITGSFEALDFAREREAWRELASLL